MAKETKKKLKKVSKASSEENEVLPYKYLITNYGADYTVDVLVKRLKEKSVVIPSFQRSYVWSIKQASRFIESLLLGLPVPGVFLSREKDTEKLLVIDGQQRLSTLLYFFKNEFPKHKSFSLIEVQKEYEGKTYKTLSDADRRKLDDAIIHATIIKQDIPTDDESSIFFVFERLNTGGVVLSAQEIRNGIYQGEFNKLLEELNKNVDWRFLYGRPNARMRDQELILRFFALYFTWETYTKPMKAYLNTFMAKNRNLQLHSKEDLTNIFSSTVKIIRKSIGAKAFKLGSQPTAALIDAVMVGVAKRIQHGAVKQNETAKKCFSSLLKDNDFILSITTSTSDEENVRERITKAIDVFSKVK